MSGPDWEILGPENYAWTPAELAQIARAAQAFLAALPRPNDGVVHLVKLQRVGVLGGDITVDWPQPGEPMERLCVAKVDGRDARIRTDSVHVHPAPGGPA